MKNETVSAGKHGARGNASGGYYINEKCIGCSLCHELSPGNFRMNLEEAYDYVHKQPETKEEEAMCLKAMQSCPADAIRNDGMGSLK